MREKSGRLSVLLLTSNEEATRLLGETLSKEAELATAWDAEELSRLLQRTGYDALLLDWECKGGVWREVCREVKQNYPALPIIVVSRCGDEKEWVEVLKEGCFDLISAPFSVRHVLYVIAHAVASREKEALELKAVA